MSRTYNEESVDMTKLEKFIFKNHIYRGHYFKILNDGNLVWFSNLFCYLINCESPSVLAVMPRNLTELYIEQERDKHC